MKNSAINERIKEIRGRQDQKEFGAVYGLTRRQISSYERGESPPPIDFLISLARTKNVNIDWLLTGEGPKHRQEYQREVQSTPDMSKLPASEYGNLTQIQVYGAAGAGDAQELWETEPIETLMVEKWRVPQNTKALRVDGTSMEPTIMKGAVALVTTNFDIVDGGIYLLRIPYEGLVVKRVYLGYKELILRSDNSLFPEIKMPLQEWDIRDIVVGKIESVLFQEVK